MREGASMDELFLEKVYGTIENNLADENFGVEELAHKIGISRSHLHRKLILLKGQTASQIIREFRLNKAMEMLQKNVATSSEISYRVGFSSPSYFNTCFRKYFGYPPGEVKKHAPLNNTGRHTILRKYLFASVILMFILALVVLNIIPRVKIANERKMADKSIAVLPFFNDSPGEEKMHFINGIMEQILENLCNIGDIRVLPRVSVEQYRDHAKSTQEIVKELNVSYLLYGSGHRDGDSVRLVLHLIDGRKDQEIWSQSYSANIHDIFPLESEIAQTVAGEIKAIITPEEKKRIEKIPTTSVTAQDFYARGRDELVKHWIFWGDTLALKNAEYYFRRALENDPNYAQVYTGLASVNMYKDFWNQYWTRDFLDTALILADKALRLDRQLAEAYVIRGKCYFMKDLPEKALAAYDKAIDLNPNQWEAYYGKGKIYQMDDFVQEIENFHKASLLNRGMALPSLLRDYAGAYAEAGFEDKAEYYLKEALKLDGDSAIYFCGLSMIVHYLGFGESNKDLIEATENLEREYVKDSSNVYVQWSLATNYMHLYQFKESLKYWQKYIKRLDETKGAELTDLAEIGYMYLKNGLKEEAEQYFEEQINTSNLLNELGRYNAHQKFTYYDLATVFAARGDKEKAYENLRKFNSRDRMPGWAILDFRYLPIFDDFREDPEFQQIFSDVEAKYLAEHERARQWLEENDML